LTSLLPFFIPTTQWFCSLVSGTDSFTWIQVLSPSFFSNIVLQMYSQLESLMEMPLSSPNNDILHNADIPNDVRIFACWIISLVLDIVCISWFYHSGKGILVTIGTENVLPVFRLVSGA